MSTLQISTSMWPAITLDEVASQAGLQSRIDRKYVVNHGQLSSALDATADQLRILQIDGARAFDYRTVYFDTPDLVAYRGAAAGRNRRFKVRTRTYLNTGTTWLEVKLRERSGMTHKQRIEYDQTDELDDGALSFLQQFEQVRPHLGRLRPSLSTSYARTTLVCGVLHGGQDAGGAQRITIDAGIECTDPDGHPVARIPQHVIVETKSNDARPGCFDRSLWRSGARPVTISKYAVGIAASRPVAANRWQRVMRRYVQTLENAG